MRITLVLKESIYDCKIKITDSRGERDYYISALSEETNSSSIIVEIFDEEFSLSLTPIMANADCALDELEENNWKDRFAKKATRSLMNSFDKMILRVGCDYNIVGLQDGDRLDITMQNFAFGTFDVLEILPMVYSFFEVANFNNFYKLTDAYETNRKDVLKFAKKFALTEMFVNGLLGILLIYPIQVGIIKHLSKNKKIFKTLKKFNNMSDNERQKFLEKQEKRFNK